jgi:membrane protease YdiL (CAAX protease family)
MLVNPVQMPAAEAATLSQPSWIQRYRKSTASIAAAVAIAALVMVLPQLAALILPKQHVLEVAWKMPIPAIELPQSWDDLPADYGFNQVRCDWRDQPPLADAELAWMRCTAQSTGTSMFMPPPPAFQAPGWQVSRSSMTSRVASPSLQALAFAVGPALAALGLMLVLGRGGYWRADLSRAATALRRPWRVLAPLTAALTMMALATLLGWTQVDPDRAEAIGKLFQRPELLLAMLLAPFWEELLLRGWLWQQLRCRLPLWLTALVVTELFVALHAANPQMLLMPVAYIATLTASGLALAWLRERHGSVALCILAHLLQNGAVAAALVFAPA